MRSALVLLVLVGCGAPTRDAALTDTAAELSHALASHAARDGAFRLPSDAGDASVTLTFSGWGSLASPRVAPRGAATPLPCVQLEEACLPAVGWRDSDIEAWWVTHPYGAQQGWTVHRVPADAATLRFDTRVARATITTMDGGVVLDGDDGSRWTVGGIRAWDARGTPLPSSLEVADDVLRVLVDAEHAIYPVTVDPVYASAFAELSAPSSASGRTGAAVAVAGDLNGDGYDDVIVGSPAQPTTYTNFGRTSIHYGRASTSSSAWGSGTALDHYAAPSYLSGRVNGYGQSVDGAGDVNGDGYADAVSAGLEGASGYAYLWMHYGGSSGVTTRTVSAGTNVPDYDPSTEGPGIVVSGAGDLNGDGYDDIVTGFWGWLDSPYGSLTGEFRLHFGSSGGLGSVGYTGYGTSTTSYTGYAVAGAGDTDGDGYDDILVGRPGIKQVALFEGRSSGIRTTETTTLSSTVSGFGVSVDGAGDVNADGYDDAVVGARNLGGTGQVFVYHGAAAGLSSTAARTLTGPVAGEPFGTSVAGGSDVDADGYDDIIVGSPSTSGTGQVLVYVGSSSGISSTVHATLTDGMAGTEYGLAVAGNGDVDADGYDDVLVGAPGYDGAKGRVALYRGYVDRDGDGYGAADDCDDGDAAFNPGATERVADGVDQDCDSVDSCYVDADGDNHGGTTTVDGSSLDCDSGAGARAADDCNDSVATISPGATEVAGNDVDEDCDGVDSCYVDGDLDGYGFATVRAGTASTCTTAGFTRTATDCDDSSAVIRPGGTETAGDAIDQDCDGVDSCYVDADGDNHGGSATFAGSSLDCASGAGAVAADDCDDANATIAPGAAETTGNDVDEDCDGVDSCYVDADLDGFGSGTVGAGAALTCTTRGFTRTATDCDDGSGTIRPGGTETAGDGVDQDCDGVDSCFVDADGDGVGASASGTRLSTDLSCGAAGLSGLSTDCDDADRAIFPGAEERVADGIDEDCDGGDLCFSDRDRDGFADSLGGTFWSADLLCSAAGEASAETPRTDCDDTDYEVRPDARENAGDGVDQDCDGLEDCFEDADLDGYGNGSVVPGDVACATSGVSSRADDCDDGDPSIRPEASEVLADGVDQDCDGGDACYLDADVDGFATEAPARSADLDCDDSGEADAGTPRTDCDDNAPDVAPGAPETPADGVDQDCDGGDACLSDADLDGYADPADVFVLSPDMDCQDVGEASLEVPRTDCDDANPELTVRRWYRDADEDGVGSAETEEACEKGAGWSLVTGDCDDTSPDAIFAGESCWAARKGLGCASTGAQSGPSPAWLLALGALCARRRSRA